MSSSGDFDVYGASASHAVFRQTAMLEGGRAAAPEIELSDDHTEQVRPRIYDAGDGFLCALTRRKARSRLAP
jgi:hypothetical protein